MPWVTPVGVDRLDLQGPVRRVGGTLAVYVTGWSMQLSPTYAVVVVTVDSPTAWAGSRGRHQGGRGHRQGEEAGDESSS